MLFLCWITRPMLGQTCFQTYQFTICISTFCHNALDPAPNYCIKSWASLVTQWLRIRLPMQATRVRALVWEDPTCCGATKSVRHKYWACALEPVLCNKRSHRSEKPVHHNEE